MGKASRRKNERRRDQQRRDIGQAEPLTPQRMWYMLGARQLRGADAQRAARSVLAWIAESPDQDAVIIRSAGPDFTSSVEDFIDFSRWAVTNGRLTSDGLVEDHPRTTEYLLEDPERIVEVLAATERANRELDRLDETRPS
jgi:hypothetical protein